MSKFSEMDIERQETGRRIKDLFPDEKKTKPQEQRPSELWKPYWQLCLDVVNAAGEVAGKDKMVITFRDPAKRHNVKDVVNEKFGGEIGCIIDKRNDNIRHFFTLVDNLNGLALKLDLDQVPGMTLMGLLVNADARDKFKYHIKKHIQTSHPPFPMDEIPAHDFRKTKTTRA